MAQGAAIGCLQPDQSLGTRSVIGQPPGTRCRAIACAVVCMVFLLPLYRMGGSVAQPECGLRAGDWGGWQQIRPGCPSLLCPDAAVRGVVAPTFARPFLRTGQPDGWRASVGEAPEGAGDAGVPGLASAGAPELAGKRDARTSVGRHGAGDAGGAETSVYLRAGHCALQVHAGTGVRRRPRGAALRGRR